MRLLLFISIVVLAGSAGDLAVTHAMKQVGTVDLSRPFMVARALLRGFRTGWMWIGFFFMAIAFFSLLALLSWADVSVVVPATASSYVAGSLGARFLLHEKVERERWIGVILVCLGVALLSAT